MSDIKYVCLSDMHLGAENSLLTSLTEDCAFTEPTKPSPVLQQLVECLRTLIEKNKGDKPTLILNGDILELALTTDNLAAMAFERFIELIWPPDESRHLFGHIVYIPGNHDHHLWETARETQYLNFIRKNRDQKPGQFLKVPWHTTKMFDPNPPVPAAFLNGIISRYRHLPKNRFCVNTVYPNYGIMSEELNRCVIFSHGHFVESMYTLMSFLRQLMFPKEAAAQSIYALEAENFAWIDFFWSTMGRSGKVGSDVELVYDKLQSEKALGRLLDNLVDGLNQRYDLPGFDPLTAHMAKDVLRQGLHAVKDRERCVPEDVLSIQAEAGLRAYLEGPVFDQILQERGGNIPYVTFVFGHTHKPFERDIANLSGYHPWIHVYNSGGWVVDTPQCAPTHGGAVILVDENFDATSVCMYSEQQSPEAYRVTVNPATHENDARNPFDEQIASQIRSDPEPWIQFSRVVAREIPKRYNNLLRKIDCE